MDTFYEFSSIAARVLRKLTNLLGRSVDLVIKETEYTLLSSNLESDKMRIYG